VQLKEGKVKTVAGGGGGVCGRCKECFEEGSECRYV